VQCTAASDHLRLKLLSSIFAISAIQLLKLFIDLPKASDREVLWSVIIHVVFVLSSVPLALSDRIAEHGTAKAPPAVGAPASVEGKH
jgi:uncharacterized protein (TIGR00645 family)